jgi:carbohydrate-binding DOMON domain-containing protein
LVADATTMTGDDVGMIGYELPKEKVAVAVP